MDQRYWNYSKENDHMDYSKIKGDPVTDLNNKPNSCIVFIGLGILLIVSLPLIYLIIML